MKRLRLILNETQLLLEYDRDITWKQHGEKALDQALKHDDSARHPVLDAIRRSDNREFQKSLLSDHIERTDPSPNKKYTQHIMRIYAKDGVRFEDLHSRMKPALKDFDELSKKKIIPAEHRDIGRIKHLGQLEDLIEPYKEQTSKRAQDKAHHERMKSESTITDHPTFTHITPHSAEAAQHFGQGTRWCTAPEDVRDSMYNHYQGAGDLHIMTPKNPKYKGEKYQVHLPNPDTLDLAKSVHYTTIMDDHDEAAHAKLQQNHPEIYDHVNNMVNDANRQSKTVAGYDHPDIATVLQTLKNYPAGTKREHIDKLLNSKNPDLVLAAANTGKVGRFDDRIYNAATKLMDDAAADTRPYSMDPGLFADGLLQHPRVHSNTIEAILDHPHGNFAKMDAAAHPNLNKEAMDDYVNSDDERIRIGIARNPNASDEHVKTLMKDESEVVRDYAHDNWRERTYESPKKKLGEIIFHGKK